MDESSRPGTSNQVSGQYAVLEPKSLRSHGRNEPASAAQQWGAWPQGEGGVDRGPSRCGHRWVVATWGWNHLLAQTGLGFELTGAGPLQPSQDGSTPVAQHTCLGPPSSWKDRAQMPHPRPTAPEGRSALQCSTEPRNCYQKLRSQFITGVLDLKLTANPMCRFYFY